MSKVPLYGQAWPDLFVRGSHNLFGVGKGFIVAPEDDRLPDVLHVLLSREHLGVQGSGLMV